mmetsp:Transcript_3192/g.6230  ORF Transcript_3192/g.6230 Transcript_3192/m.6230 type:complete len:443 (-) Transcript_3192:114-1442(-)
MAMQWCHILCLLTLTLHVLSDRVDCQVYDNGTTVCTPMVPAWPATYDLSRSTVIMACNYSGWFDPIFLGKWGLVDLDWSNAKNLWANAKPMDCQERLVEQVRAIKAVNPTTRVFIYRNLVKALPWFSDVRTKINDPAYSGWFLRFKDGINGTYRQPPCTGKRCSEFYHDQWQTPQHPHETQADGGNCTDECDCGGVPCGEYLFDHRNDSLRAYLVEQHIMGPDGIGNPLIDGVNLDDRWYDHPFPAGACSGDPFGGPTEEFSNCTQDMGLTQADTTALHTAWKETMTATYKSILGAGAYTMETFYGIPGAPKQGAACAAYFQRACQQDSSEQRRALFMGFTARAGKPAYDQDIATFLLVRGPYAWIGYGWISCANGASPVGEEGQMFYRPPRLETDFGTPEGLCAESTAGSGVFTRKWTKGTVSLDCNTWEASFSSQNIALV